MVKKEGSFEGFFFRLIITLLVSVLNYVKPKTWENLSIKWYGQSLLTNDLDADYVGSILSLRKPDIPPNSSITYIIELVKKDYPMDYESMSASEKLKYG